MGVVLVTGGAGFIGSELVRQLVERGDDVLAVDNLVNGKRENLGGLPLSQVRLAVADVRDGQAMADLLAGADIVFHLACLGVRHSVHSPQENHEVNATATLQLLTAARAAGVKRFVHVSSSEVYGTAHQVPMTEEHPTCPNTVYGASKLAGECYARAFYRTYGYPTVVVRPFNTYGPRCHHEGDSGEVIPKFMLRCMAGRPMMVFGDGTQTRDFTYVGDTARGILLAGMADAAVGQTINLGSGHEIAVNDLAHEVAMAAGYPDAAVTHEISRPGDVLRLYADTTKAGQLLGFRPQVAFQEGLARLRDWYQGLGQSPEELLRDELVRNWEAKAPVGMTEAVTGAAKNEGKFVPVARPWMGEAEAGAARRAILSGWVTQGPEVAALEREFAAIVGAGHSCAVSNCTTALHLALRAVGVRPGDEVITVSHSFIATANSIRHCGATPVFVDIQPETFNLAPARITEVIGPRTRAILCVHQIGLPCDLPAILAIARRHGLPVIEDAACAVGSEILWEGRWEKIGKPHGDIACFSFHPRKLLTTGDGGMITTNCQEWDARFRLWRQHGMGVPDTVRHGAGQVIFEDYAELGYNYRMTDIQAAVGREQLKRLPEIVARRREQTQRYRQLLEDIPGLALPHEPEWARSNWQSFCIRLPETVDQRTAMQSLLGAGIASRRGIMCAHREPAYMVEPWSCGEGPGSCGCAAGTCRRLRESERAQDLSILLPLYHQMTEADQAKVAAALRGACSR